MKQMVFSEKNKDPKRRVQDLRYLCFAGAETVEEAGIEVKEICDVLGIPRNHVTSLERDPEKAERLRRANLGIEVICREADQYFLHANPAPFDIISLDYTGQQTITEACTLEYIASRQLLAPKGIIATVYSGRRESESMQKLLANRLLHQQRQAKFMEAWPDNDFSTERFRAERLLELEQMLDRQGKEGNLEGLRDGITTELVTIFMGGTINRPMGKSMFSDEPYKETVIQGVKNDLPATRDLDFLRKLNGLSDRANVKFSEDPVVYEQGYYTARYAQLVHKLSQLVPADLARSLLHLQGSIMQKSYHYNAFERYKYTSNSGCPMLMDLFSFSQVPEGIKMRLSDIFSFKQADANNDCYVKINPLGWSLQRLVKRMEYLHQYMEQVVRLPLAPRIELIPERPGLLVSPSAQRVDGLSPSEGTEGDIISRHTPRKLGKREKYEIAQMLRDPAFNESEILDAYSITRGQLSAIKAHNTMGTYTGGKDAKGKL